MKQVIAVNGDLTLPRGKLAAQVAHAAVAAFLAADAAARSGWLEEGMPKIVVEAPDAQALLALEQRAREAGLPSGLVRDAGKTVVESGTITCLGLGPAGDEHLDALTGDLPLCK